MLLTQMLTSHDPSTFVREWEARGLHGTVADSLSQGSSPRGPMLPDTGRSPGEPQQQQHAVQREFAEPSRTSYQQSMLGVQQQQQSQVGSQQPQAEPLPGPAVLQAQQNPPPPPILSQSNAAADRQINAVQPGSLAARGGNSRQQDRAQEPIQQGSRATEGIDKMQDRAQASVQQGSGTTQGIQRLQDRAQGPVQQGISAQAAEQAWQVQAPASPQGQLAGPGRQQPGNAAASAPGPAPRGVAGHEQSSVGSGTGMRGTRAGSDQASANLSSEQPEASMRPEGQMVRPMVVPGARTATAPSTKPGLQLKQATQPSGMCFFGRP